MENLHIGKTVNPEVKFENVHEWLESIGIRCGFINNNSEIMEKVRHDDALLINRVYKGLPIFVSR